MASPEVRILPTTDEMVQAAAAFIVDLAAGQIRQGLPFTIALSGGSTPRRLYETLASPPHASRLSWSRWEVFWGDERTVPPDHPDSNYRMALISFLDHVTVPSNHIHRMRGEVAPQEAADAYEDELRRVLGGPIPIFDLVLLGMGTDGHTASLFSATEALDQDERIVVANWVPTLNTHRLTLTLPIINAARHILFLVSGRDKAEALRTVLGPNASDEAMPPAARVRPASGTLHWYLDPDAASLLAGSAAV
jgi:6-phosphogluconolactonase